MTKPLRFGIIGSSKITNRHIRTIKRLPHATVLGVHGTHQPALQDLRETHGVRIVSLEELLREAPDVAVVTTSSERHGEILNAIQPAVKNLLVEKPLTTRLSEANKVANSARQYGNRVFVVSQLRFDPGFGSLRARVQQFSGPLGIAIDVRKNRGKNYYRQDSSLSKAVFYSQLPHYLDLIGELLGGGVQVRDARAENRQKISRFPDYLQVTLGNQRGNAEITVSTSSPKNQPVEITVRCEGNQIQSRDFTIQRDTLWPWWRRIVGPQERSQPPDQDADFLRMYEDLLHRLNGESGSDDLQRAVETVESIDRVIRLSGYPLAI